MREVLHNIDDKRLPIFALRKTRTMRCKRRPSFLTGLFRESNRSARNAKRIKITAGDFRLVHDLISCKGLDQLMNEKLRYNFGGHLQLPSPCRLYSYQKRTISINMFSSQKGCLATSAINKHFLVSVKSRCKQIKGSGVVGRLSRWSDHNPSHYE